MNLTDDPLSPEKIERETDRQMLALFFTWFEAASPDLRKMARIYIDELVPYPIDDRECESLLEAIDNLIAKS